MNAVDKAVSEITSRAMAGDAEAIAKVVSLAFQLCGDVRNLAGFHPQIVDAIARQQTAWPLVVDIHPEMQARALRWLKALPLGESSGWRPTKKKPYSFRSQANLTMKLEIQTIATEKGTPWASPEVAGLPLNVSREWFDLAWERLCRRGDPAKSKDLRSLGVKAAESKVRSGKIKLRSKSYESEVRYGIHDRLKNAFELMFLPKK